MRIWRKTVVVKLGLCSAINAIYSKIIYEFDYLFQLIRAIFVSIKYRRSNMTDLSLWAPPADALSIWDGTPPGFRPEYGQPVPTLMPYLVSSRQPGAAVVVLPGGGYQVKAAHEAEPIALWLNSLGISAFVLDYRVAPYHSPVPMLDARRAIQFVRSRAAQWQVDPQRVGILGFSAGGHLASTAGTHFEDVPSPDDALAKFSYRPDALILCYPVISFGEYGHVGSMENLLGVNPPENLREAFSNEKQVSAQTPPTFLWHTATDAAVPIENSLMFARVLAACKVPFEIHVFASGEHGVGLAQGHPYAEPWTDLCGRWLRNLGFASL
jgi:acetyl esterase/lipase